MENRVIDSRLAQESTITRRRRLCDACGQRFTTYERVEEVLPWVIKRDQRREPFSRDKIFAGLDRACVKRPVSREMQEVLVSQVERYFSALGEKEVRSDAIGAQVLAALRDTDRVAYIRFASVYRQFRDVDEFVDELAKLGRSSTQTPEHDVKQSGEEADETGLRERDS